MPWYIHTIDRCYAPGAQTEVREVREDRGGTIYSKWVRAVCEPYTDGRLFAAWEVYRGRAYAFKWPKPGDFEKIEAQR